ncbi:trehalase [Orussus abietinus]|uniref:trehalase n=1 Tax=Orussus abietinus TaxID=222816 RepID=UPI000625F066|nr:trehalase [Orussus abietinus]
MMARVKGSVGTEESPGKKSRQGSGAPRVGGGPLPSPVGGLLAGLLGLLLLAGGARTASIRRPPRAVIDYCDSLIYCRGELLKTVQLADIFPDSKTFVDLTQLNDPNVTYDNFEKLMKQTNGNPNRTQIEDFVWANFKKDDELLDWKPPDWQENPAILARIQDPKFRQLAKDLNSIWNTLARKMSPDVAANPGRHSLIYVDKGFIIPGGRFKEFYYWDSYWIVEGLLLTGMHQTVKGILENLLSMVSKFGFIPNGGRVYYLMRSQPPLVIPMVERYAQATNDWAFVENNIGLLEKEFIFWQRERTVDVTKNGKTYKMARYVVSSEGPRPESYREDYKVAQNAKDEKSKNELYNQLKAAAESGWDFSARWFAPENGNLGNLSDASVSEIIPVDLNAFLQRNARILGELYQKLGNLQKAQHFFATAVRYQLGIDKVLWDEKEGVWLDYNFRRNRPTNRFYPSNLTPLYTHSYDPAKSADIARKVLKYLEKIKITSFMGGTPASLDHTTQQWDLPNAWPPLQSIVVNGLRNTGFPPALRLAQDLAVRWLRANLIGYSEYSEMFEKYDAVFPGQYGGGGEYTVQAGFGWTNGIVFEFLDIYPNVTADDSRMMASNSLSRK